MKKEWLRTLGSGTELFERLVFFGVILDVGGFL